MTDAQRYDVVVVGGGVAGRSAATFLARHDFRTVVLDAGGSILRRNAHLENYPGFPAGVDARRLLDLMGEQAERAGAEYREAEVTRVQRVGEHEVDDDEEGVPEARFDTETADGERYRSAHVVAATKNATDYLALDGVELVDRGKTFVAADERGRTGVEGLYAAGRLAGKPHQAVVAAGHGADDWVAPEGYFTGRGREVPPGCEEIGDDERRQREAEARDAMRDHFDQPHPEGPEMHPSVADEEDEDDE
jgi:thioredoxin reductase